jgi:chaperonin GroES
MNTPLTPIKNRVLCSAIEPENKTSAIIIPDNALQQEGKELFVVLGCGPEVKEIQVGNKVLASKYGGTDCKIDGVAYSIFKETDVLGVFIDAPVEAAA